MYGTSCVKIPQVKFGMCQVINTELGIMIRVLEVRDPNFLEHSIFMEACPLDQEDLRMIARYKKSREFTLIHWNVNDSTI